MCFYRVVLTLICDEQRKRNGLRTKYANLAGIEKTAKVINLQLNLSKKKNKFIIYSIIKYKRYQIQKRHIKKLSLERETKTEFVYLIHYYERYTGDL